jgi:hypothetical protein
MKKAIFIVLSLFFGCLSGQINLVLNPSFESYTTCPSGLSQINKAIGWYAFNGTPDYFNPCTGDPSAQVPGNSFGNQLPYQGNCYGGIITYYSSSLSREILGVQLLSPLSISQKYFVSFMVARGNDNIFVGYSANKMGVRLSKVQSFTVSINNTSHYCSNVVISDTLNWTRIAGSFVSDSAYQYLMIGNFYDDANTIVTNQSSGIYAYYFIDDVCLSTDSTYCAEYATGLRKYGKENTIKLRPNPANEYFEIDIGENENINILNCFGDVVYFGNQKKVFCENWPSGFYIARSKTRTSKLIINH